MSAIAGIIQFDGEPVPIEDGQYIMDALMKYPADCTDTWQERNAFLGCHAGWITPESVHERLPYYDEETMLAITADAIIDNRNELFDRLEVEVNRRKQMTDSALILLAYRKWGQDAPKYLIGDFAFMIWDAGKQLLFGARDLLGSRSLYYHYDRHRFVFCSAISPMFDLPDVSKELHEAWFSEFLAIPHMIETTDVFSTAYRNIMQVPPAHSVLVAGGRVSVSQYGTLVHTDKLQLKSSGEYLEAFREVFKEAVASRLRSHRQVGATLSGGLDSSAVVSIAAKELLKDGKTLHTYSSIPVHDFVDWTDRGSIADERPFIQATVEHVGNIKDNYLDLAGRSPLSEIDDLLDLLEAPYKNFENSFWIKGIYEEAARHQVKVLLTGARGNYTVSWGSAIDYYAILFKKLRWIQFYRELKLFSRQTGIGRSRLLPIIGKYAFPFIQAPVTNEPDVQPLIHPDFARRTGVFEKLQNQDVGLTPSSVNVLEERQNYFRNLAALNLQGTAGAKMSLRYGLTERDPTCDPRLVRFCLSVPFEQYTHNGIGRSLVRRSTENDLPDKVRLNQRTRGIQGADWLHRLQPAWRMFTDEIKQLCNDPAASGMLNVSRIRTSLASVGESPRPDQAFDPDTRFLMRSLIAFRFIKKLQ
ncbi:asparagine synthetase B [Paenibacillus sp. sptzw28]|uniref:asparagine synthase-related protein n=1 Tax=Paenibacillus sp. sptzw28 TaxID=715179 RepID=UPI001C6E8953|nr:asparagine synthase-related protein [Paenibacillus sp. sptzw28]QYR20614.1 asparagine synthetase B [Paenibacillus sp. sptzw28]